MRTAWNIVSILLLTHVLAAGAFVAWLGMDGRLNRERLGKVVEIFGLTIAEEQQQIQRAAELELQASEQAADLARVEQVSQGPVTLGQRMAQADQSDEVQQQESTRAERERADLLRQLDAARHLLARERAALLEERKAFEEHRQKELARTRDEDFQQAVAMYEQVRPRQAKQMFQELLAKGETQRVVEYLAAMQLRKAAAVLKEFKLPPEVTQATQLIEQLRSRGIDTAGMTPQPSSEQGDTG